MFIKQGDDPKSKIIHIVEGEELDKTRKEMSKTYNDSSDESKPQLQAVEEK